MNELLQANWWLLVISLLVGLVIAWWIFVGRRRTKVEREDSGDVLDEGGRRAARNQALIDAPPSAGDGAGLAMDANEGSPPGAGAGDVPTAAVAGAGAMVGMAAAEQMRGEKENLATDDATPESPPPTPPHSRVDGQANGGDDLTRIKGIGPKLADRLRELGVTSWAQIAAWNDDEQARIDAELGRFAGRPARDDWRLQARLLAEGDDAAFVERFGQG